MASPDVTAGTIRGRELTSLLPPGYGTERQAGVIKRLSDDRGTLSFSGDMLTREGRRKTIERRLRALEGGASVLFLGHDMNEERRLEAEQNKRAEELRRSNAELQQFAFVASPDLKCR